jgi:hypothetical protein
LIPPRRRDVPKLSDKQSIAAAVAEAQLGPVFPVLEKRQQKVERMRCVGA